MNNAEIPNVEILPPPPLRPLVGVLMALKPSTVIPSKLSFRPPLSPTDPTDLELRASIWETRGNATAGLVMRSADLDPSGVALYQVIAGHRALAVCRELGFDFNTVVVDALPDAELALRMAHSNSGQKPMPGIALGRFYQECMDRRLFKSQADMARRFNVSMAMVSTSCSLAKLPAVVISAFPSEDAIQHRYGKPLKAALANDEKTVLDTAERLTGQQAKLVDKISAAKVFAELTHAARKEIHNQQPDDAMAHPASAEPAGGVADAIAASVQAIASIEGLRDEAGKAFGTGLPGMSPVNAQGTSEIPASNMRLLRRDGDGLKASAIVRPSNDWRMLVDQAVDVGFVVRLTPEELQATVTVGGSFTDDLCRALADCIAAFVKKHIFKPESDKEA